MNRVCVRLNDYVYIQLGLAAHRAGKSIAQYVADSIAERCNAPEGGTSEKPAKKGAEKVQCTRGKAVK